MLSDRLLYEHTPALLQAIDQEGRIIAVSHQWLMTMGYGRDSVMGQPWQTFLTPASQRLAAQYFSSTGWHQASDLTVELDFVPHAGEVMTMSFSANVVPDEREPLGYCLAVLTPVISPQSGQHASGQYRENLDQRVRDLTAELAVANQRLQQAVRDRTLAENARLQSEHRFRLIAETIEDVFWIDDAQRQRPLYTSPTLKKVWGLSPESLEDGFEPLLECVYPEDRDLYQRWTDNSFIDPNPSAVEFRIYHPSGEVRWLYERCFPVLNDTNAPHQILGIITDITARKRAEESLRQYERIISATPDPICLIDRTYTYRLVNQAYENWLNQGQTLAGAPLVDVIGSDFFTRIVRPRLDKALAGETQRFEEWAYNPSNAEDEFISITYAPYYEADGTISGVVNSVRNLTALKRTRDRLTKTTERLRLHIANSPLAVIEWDMDIRIQGWSSQTMALFGWSAAEVENKHFTEIFLFPPEDLSTIRTYFDELCHGQNHHQIILTRNHNRQGNIIYCEWYNSALLDDAGNLISILSLVQDVTQKYQAQAALLASEERWQLALRGSNDGIWDWQVATNEVFFSARWKELLGYADHELTNTYQTWENLVHPEDLPGVLIQLESHLSGETPSYHAEYRMQTKTGEYRWILARAKAIFDEVGNPIRVVGSHSDVTDRVQAEAARRQGDLRFKAFFEQSAISMAQIALDGTYIRVNPAFCQLVGYNAADLIGEHAAKVTHPDDLPCDTRLSHEVAIGKIPAHSFDKRFVRSDGEVRYVQVVVTGVSGDQNSPVFLASVYNDITERVTAENALRNVVEGTAAVVGDDFFPVLAQQLAQSLEVDHILINQLEGEQLTTLVFWSQNQIQTGFTYPIIHTPCAHTLAEGCYCCPANVQAMFPQDADLIRLNAESYLGVVLMGETGNRLGEICAIHSQPIQHLDNAAAILRIFAARASAELERQQSNQALRDSEARFQRLAANMPGVIYRYHQYPDGSDRFSFLSAACHEIWELDPEIVYADSATVWDLVYPPDRDKLQTAIAVSQRHQKPLLEDYRIITPSGHLKWLQVVARPVIEPDGCCLWDGIFIDITECKATERALRDSEALNRAILGALPDLLLRMRGDGLCLDMQYPKNFPVVCSKEAHLGRKAQDVLTPTVAAARMVAIGQALKTGSTQIYEYQIPIDDQNRWEEARVVPLATNEVLVLVRDIDDRKQAEAALRQSEVMNRAIIGALPDLFIRLRRDGLCLDLQYPSHYRIICPPEQQIGRSIQVVMSPDLAEQRLEMVARALDNNTIQIYEYQILLDGQWRWEEARVVPIEADEVLILVRDIDDRKQTEEALKASETLNRAIVEALPDMLIRMRKDGLCLGLSYPPECSTVLGNDYAIGRNIRDILPPEIVEQRLAISAQTLATQKTQIAEYQLTVQGQLRWEESRIVPVAENEVLVLVRDIDERKQAEQEIHRLNQELEQQNHHLEELVEQRTSELMTFMNALPDQIFVVDCATNQMTFGNDGMARFAAKQHRKEFEGRTVFECFPPAQAIYYHRQNREVFNTGQGLHVEESMETPAGTLYLDTYKIPLTRPDDSVYALISTSRDVTELVQAREALTAQTAQLEATNQELQAFSYSVSHDLRAPLRHINGFIAALQQRLQATAATDAKVAHYLDIISRSSQKMGLLIDGLLTLSRVGRRELVMRPVALKPLVENTLALLEVPLQPSQPLQITLDDLPTVQGDSTLLQQVFTNLLDNAMKFSRDRTPAQIHIGYRSDGTFWVQDNGVGFDMTYADKLFSPFQRLHSSEQFQGTGIGLAIVQRIIHRHGGQIWGESAPDRGTTIFFTLPSL